MPITPPKDPQLGNMLNVIRREMVAHVGAQSEKGITLVFLNRGINHPSLPGIEGLPGMRDF